MQCTNHVKQISLALHNFADVYKEVLPSDGYVGNINQGPYTKAHYAVSAAAVIPDPIAAGNVTNASVLVSILPYVEQQAIYEKFSFAATSVRTATLPTTLTTTTAAADEGWGIVVPAGTAAATYAAEYPTITNAKINYFTCPSGNHTGAKTAPFVASYVGIAGGTNFGADGLVPSQTLSYGQTASAIYLNSTGASGGAAVAAPLPVNFQTASLTNGVFPAGKAGTLKMADGTSNTIVFGEISWAAGAVDASVNAWSAATTATQLGAWYQGAVIAHAATSSTATLYQSYYTKVVTPFDLIKVTASGTTASATFAANTASATQSLAPHKVLNGGKSKTTNVGSGTVKQYLSFERASNAGSWGSNHTSVVVFGLGDGSVRGVSDSVGNNIICNLAAANDGVAVTLP
jgi:hypothetical protein